MRSCSLLLCWAVPVAALLNRTASAPWRIRSSHYQMRAFFASLLHFLFQLNYFGPLVMGIMDSSFLFLPFGNDLVIVGLAAGHPKGIPWYVLSAACGSTIGAFLLAWVSRKLGEEGIRKISGNARYQKLRKRIGHNSGPAVALAGVAPPPFPFTTVIAAVAALDYPISRILLINFFSRAVRFTVLALLAMKFGRQVVNIARSAPFAWSMLAFVALCLIVSGFTVTHWLRSTRKKPA